MGYSFRTKSHEIDYHNIYRDVDFDSLTYMEMSKFLQPVDVPIKKCGIYFLFLNGDLRYIGQSKDIEMRIREHIVEKPFDRVLILQLPTYDKTMMDHLEHVFIARYRPIYNKSCRCDNPDAITDDDVIKAMCAYHQVVGEGMFFLRAVVSNSTFHHEQTARRREQKVINYLSKKISRKVKKALTNKAISEIEKTNL